MPNKASARKRVRQNETRRIRNRSARSEMRSAVKKAVTVIAEKKTKEVAASLSEAQSKLAKAAKRNLIKKNKLARTQSRLMKAANKASKGAA